MIIKFLQSTDDDKERIGFPFLIREHELELCVAPRLIETSSFREPSVIFAAHLSERDYELARDVIPELRAFQDYEDWLDFRQGSLWGLEMAGFKVEVIPVSLRAFETWRRTASTPPCIPELDQFARVHAQHIVNERGDEAPH
jgi:hypothetical protein